MDLFKENARINGRIIMLSIYARSDFPKDCITTVDSYFNMHKKRDWFNRQDVKDIILGIDSTIAVKDEYLESPVFGGMSPDRLSRGCKATILLAVLDNPIIYYDVGDNCAKYVLDIAKQKDIAIILHHCMIFPDEEMEAYMVATDKYVSSRREYIIEFWNTYNNS